MPVYTLQAPDGKTYDIEGPEGATAEQLGAFIQSQSQPQLQVTSQVQSLPQQQSQQEPTLSQKIQASIPGRIIQGGRDVIDAAAELAPRALEKLSSYGGLYENPVSRFFGKQAGEVEALNKANEQQYQQARKATGDDGLDIARGIGGIVPFLATGGESAALTLPQKLASAMRSGALVGAATPESMSNDNNGGFWTKKAEQVLEGSALGAGGVPITEGMSRILSPQVKDKVALLLKEGITPTMGQIMGRTGKFLEEKATSIPILGDMIRWGHEGANEQFNKAALNRALEPIGEKVDNIGREGITEVRQKLGDAYNSLLDKLNFIPDQQFTEAMTNLKGMAQNLSTDAAKRFNSIMDDVEQKQSPNGGMAGETYKIVESKLKNAAQQFSSSSDSYQRELGNALKQVIEEYRLNLVRSNPEYAKELANINRGWANYSILRNAASGTAAGANEGIFTPAKLAQAVRASDKSVGKRASAEGTALMQDLAEAGTTHLSNRYPDSGTAGRLALIQALRGLTATGATGIGAAISPLTLGLGTAAGFGFFGPGKKAMAAALTQRPEIMKQLAKKLPVYSPLISGGTAKMGLQELAD